MKKRMKQSLVFVLIACLLLMSVACSTETTETEATETEGTVASETETEATEAEEQLSGEGLKFISITTQSSNLSGIAMNEGAREVLEAAGAEFTVQYFENNTDDMVEMIENAVSAGYDGMILQSKSFDAGVEAIQSALDAGMIICEYDGDYADIEGIQYWFGGSNYDIGYAIGQMAGEWANENLVPNGIDVIAGSFCFRGAEDFVLRSDGLIDGLTEACPEAQVVREEQAMTTVDAVTIVENWLQAYPELNIVMGIADTVVSGGAEALAAAGKDPAYAGCFGTDAIEVALQGIAEGGIYKGTLDLGLKDAGRTMAQFMLEDLNGIEVEGREKYNYFNITPITEANIDDYWPIEE